MFFLWYLLIGLVAGWIANLIVKGRGSGLLVNLVVGIIGRTVIVTAAVYWGFNSDRRIATKPSS